MGVMGKWVFFSPLLFLFWFNFSLIGANDKNKVFYWSVTKTKTIKIPTHPTHLVKLTATEESFPKTSTPLGSKSKKLPQKSRLLWHIHTARNRDQYWDRNWEQEQWISIYCAVLFTLHWDRDKNVTHCLLLCSSYSLYLSPSQSCAVWLSHNTCTSCTHTTPVHLLYILLCMFPSYFFPQLKWILLKHYACLSVCLILDWLEIVMDSLFRWRFSIPFSNKN